MLCRFQPIIACWILAALCSAGNAEPLQAGGTAATNSGDALREHTISLPEEFILTDHLKHRWKNELITERVSLPADCEPADLRLIGPAGKPVPAQFTPYSKPAKDKRLHGELAFLADVPPLKTVTYRLETGPSTEARTGLQAGKTGDGLLLAGSGIEVLLAADNDQAARGPIRSIRLGKNTWAGSARLMDREVKSYTARIVADGPVYCKAVCNYTFTDDTSWHVTFQLVAGEPVVLVDERFDTMPGAGWRFLMTRVTDSDDAADHGADWDQRSSVEKLDHETVLCPWPTWWESKGRAYHLYPKQQDDAVLYLSMRHPHVWARRLPRSMTPIVRTQRTRDVRVPIRSDEKTVRVDFAYPENGRGRSWMVGMLNGERIEAQAKRLHMKHGRIPLDKVRRYTLSWPGRETHPRLYVDSRAEAQRVAEQSRDRKDAVTQYMLTGDEADGEKVFQHAAAGLAARLRELLKKPHGPRGVIGYSFRLTQGVIIPADLVLDAPFVRESQRDLFRARLAFIAYELMSPDRLSPRRGWSANPNMTCAWYSALGLISCLLKSHPDAGTWFERAWAEIDLELETWSGPNGGWLEAPHYMNVALDMLVPFTWAASRSGYGDLAHDPRLKRTFRYAAMISTPPDIDCENRRLMPAVGNTYHGESTCVTGWAAKLWADKDPTFARHMQWIWKQHGSPDRANIGGATPGLSHFRWALLDPKLPAEAPQWGSVLFPAVGVVFRSAFPGERENYMFLRSGPFAEHWDYDQGAVIAYAKGRPLMRDWSYKPYTPYSWLHNRVSNNHSAGGDYWNDMGGVRSFARLGPLDYTRTSQVVPPGREGPRTFQSFEGEWPFRQREPNGPLHWQRQILFVHPEQADEPAYFVLGDFTKGETWMEWTGWFCAKTALDVSTNPVHVTGRHDVDCRVFFASPAQPNLNTLHAEVHEYGPTISQELIHLAQRAGSPVVTAVYPYIRVREHAPQFVSFADGRGVQIKGTFGVDYHVLSDTPTKAHEDPFHCDAPVASVQDRTQRLILSLPEGGQVSYGQRSLSADGPVCVAIDREHPEVRLYTDGLAREIDLTIPGVCARDWEEDSQHVLEVTGPHSVRILLPQGWSELRLRAPHVE